MIFPFQLVADLNSRCCYKLTLNALTSPGQDHATDLVPLLDILAIQKPQRLSGQPKAQSLVYRLFTVDPEDLQDTDRPGLEESTETVRPLASNCRVR